MAENKQSILVYADWMKKFDVLTDEEAGKLIKHFFRYVNDLNPTAPDRMTELLFIDIEATLKRDLKKWEKTKGIKSDSGALGNLKRWHNDLYLQVTSNKITLEQAVSLSKERKLASGSDENDRTAIKTVANIAVSVSDSVNVSVSDKKDNTSTIPSVGLPTSTPTVNGSKASVCKRFVDKFNEIRSKSIGKDSKYKPIKSLEGPLAARIKDYTREEITCAVNRAFKHKFHKENNFQYLTPEYILRPAIMERYVNMTDEEAVSTTTELIYTESSRSINHAGRE